MAYIIAEPYLDVNDTACTDVCPVDCIHPAKKAEASGQTHGAIYDVTTGKVLGPPAPKGVARYNVRVEGENIEVEM